jgi:hypothetical protein
MIGKEEDTQMKLMEEQKKVLSDIIREFGIDEQGTITVRTPFDREKKHYIDGFWHKIIPYVFMKISLLYPTKEDGKNSLRADMLFFPRLKNALMAAEQAVEKMGEVEFNEYRQRLALSLINKNAYVYMPYGPVEDAKKLYNVEYKEPVDADKISERAKKEFRKDFELVHLYLNQCTHGNRLKAVYNLRDMQDLYDTVIYAELKLLNIKKEMFQYFGEEELKKRKKRVF